MVGHYVLTYKENTQFCLHAVKNTEHNYRCIFRKGRLILLFILGDF